MISGLKARSEQVLRSSSERGGEAWIDDSYTLRQTVYATRRDPRGYCLYVYERRVANVNAIEDTVLKQLFKLNRVYREAKEHAIEESVNAVEIYERPWVAVFPLALLVFFWIGATSTPIGPVELFEVYEFSPIIVILAVSYFSFFLGSKIVFRPTLEELRDDTSRFAVFSACKRRENRSLISIALAVLHTFVFVLFLISKDSKLLDVIK